MNHRGAQLSGEPYILYPSPHFELRNALSNFIIMKNHRARLPKDLDSTGESSALAFDEVKKHSEAQATAM